MSNKVVDLVITRDLTTTEIKLFELSRRIYKLWGLTKGIEGVATWKAKEIK